MYRIWRRTWPITTTSFLTICPMQQRYCISHQAGGVFGWFLVWLAGITLLAYLAIMLQWPKTADTLQSSVSDATTSLSLPDNAVTLDGRDVLVRADLDTAEQTAARNTFMAVPGVRHVRFSADTPGNASSSNSGTMTADTELADTQQAETGPSGSDDSATNMVDTSQSAPNPDESGQAESEQAETDQTATSASGSAELTDSQTAASSALLSNDSEPSSNSEPSSDPESSNDLAEENADSSSSDDERSEDGAIETTSDASADAEQNQGTNNADTDDTGTGDTSASDLGTGDTGTGDTGTGDTETGNKNSDTMSADADSTDSTSGDSSEDTDSQASSTTQDNDSGRASAAGFSDSLDDIDTSAISFEFSSATLTPESKPVLDSVIAVLKDHPEGTLTVTGHTDSVGSAEANQAISQGRADAVRNYLIEQGITPDRISATGFGESRPIATNETSEGRKQNRRIELDY